MSNHYRSNYLGHWGECDPQKCTDNALFTEEDNKFALEVSDLIKEYEISDTVNNDINTRLESTIPFECPCIDVKKCERTKNLIDYANTMSKFHPQRKGIITYMRSQICDLKNRRITCCGKRLGSVPEASPQPSNTSSPSAQKVYYPKN